ncbi:hypothetical protein PV396_07915 [Streptomyces sp. ME02-8801-2C]|nr:hypothetical protein [Streptomyces sp. ME02-8801-2C]MDX3451871.1 hypothetical protein [Streptomyces sp. ME02-8801-2C]
MPYGSVRGVSVSGSHSADGTTWTTVDTATPTGANSTLDARHAS